VSYIGQQLPADVFSGYTTDSFTGDGSATTFTLSKAPFSEDTLIVVINNVIQKPTTNFTVSGTTLTIVGTAVASGDVIYAIHTGGVLPITTASAVAEGTTIDLNGGSDKLILDADADTTISADTDDQIDFKAGGTDRMSVTSSGVDVTGAITASSASSINVTGGSALTLKSTDAGSSAGPVLLLDRDSASPANSDELGAITFRGRNDADQDIDFFKIKAKIADDTDGTEDGTIVFENMLGGTARSIFQTNHAEICFNEDSQNYDFRVESNNYEFCLVVDGGNDRVGIGNRDQGPGVTLDLRDAQNDVVFSARNTLTSGNIYGQQIIFGYAPDNKTSHFFYCADTVANRFFIYSDGDILADGQSINSDERLKENIVDATTKWDDVKSLKVRNFNWKKDHHPNRQHKHIGFIAQEFETVFPSLVRETNLHPDPKYTQEDKDAGNIPDGKSVGDEKNVLNRKSIHTTALVPILTKTLQEAMAKIETLETKVKALEDA